jgi:hypothetical protein
MKQIQSFYLQYTIPRAPEPHTTRIQFRATAQALMNYPEALRAVALGLLDESTTQFFYTQIKARVNTATKQQAFIQVRAWHNIQSNVIKWVLSQHGKRRSSDGDS